MLTKGFERRDPQAQTQAPDEWVRAPREDESEACDETFVRIERDGFLESESSAVTAANDSGADTAELLLVAHTGFEHLDGLGLSTIRSNT